MKAAPYPADEAVRLTALRSYHILDSVPEPAFDEVTQLASALCNMPIALISLIDEDRQWFKSKVGLNVRETHRDLAFCAHAILTPDVMLEVEDTLKDIRFHDSPLVTGNPTIRFYAGCPLQTAEGVAIGTLCIIDRKPGKLTEQQKEALRVLAKQVMIQLELRRALIRAAETARLLEHNHEERERLIAKLTASNTELDRFAYVASHDMQEPLRTIANFSSLIADEYAAKLDEEGLVYLNQVTQSARRMQDMVTDLLEYARLSHDAARCETVSAETELRAALESLAYAIGECNARITHDTLPPIKGNSVQFRRLLQNLIGNALKYQPADTRPHVHIGVQDAGDAWHFSISDNGLGIDPDFREAIFEPFRRLHSWQDYKGTGIGLTVCKRIVENYGGRIWASPGQEKGSVFHFTLPKIKQ